MPNRICWARPIFVRFSAVEPSAASFQMSYRSLTRTYFPSVVHCGDRSAGGGSPGWSSSSSKNFSFSLPVRFVLLPSASATVNQSLPSNASRCCPVGDRFGRGEVYHPYPARSGFFSPVRTFTAV
jgi:hypothetical protein